MRAWSVRLRRLTKKLRRWQRSGGLQKGRGLWIGSMLGIAAALLLICSVEYQLRPVLESMAEAEVKNAIVKMVDAAVADQLVRSGGTYEDFIHMETDETGRTAALTSDMTQLNWFRTQVLGAVVEKVEAIRGAELSIPVGNLTGIHILSGKGFHLPIEVISVGSVHGNYRHTFSDAGINQTRHQILLELTVTADILLPGETLTTEVTTEIPVAETVIVGQVPDTYLSLLPTA